MLYVLIVISQVNYGQSVTMQEFTSKENCMIAGNVIKDNQAKIDQTLSKYNKIFIVTVNKNIQLYVFKSPFEHSSSNR